MAKDPVCNMEVDTESALHTSQYQGKTVYFCSEDCKETFDKNPKQYESALAA